MELRLKYKFKVLFMFFLVSCSSNLTKKDKNTHISESSKIDTLDGFKTVEYISIDSMMIEGNIPFVGKKQDISSYLSSPDSVDKRGYDCGSEFDEEKTQIFFFGKSELEVSTTKYAFRKIFFLNSIQNVTYKNIVFDNEYTVQDFSKDFPYSYQNMTEHNREKESYVSSNIQMDFDLSWRFNFINGKLYSIWYFIPC
ncbi:hypothetical protein ACE193_25535 (plasmid) [Bernardetia sp. OM2101]|uniref:hypothetical protein n=1 Tax=Bernardetia sp. OM2101 TaxID=3344876 RepID=UPI0035D04092